jgi:hypothetical protein
LGRFDRYVVQHGTQGLADTFKPIEAVHRSKHVR